MMNKNQEALLSLLTYSIGDNKKLLVGNNVDWSEVMNMSFYHEVSSIVFDSYRTIHSSLGNESLSMDDVMEWLGQVAIQETQYEAQYKSAAKLAELYYTNHIRTYVLKGFSISLCYPMPFHRYSCDFDCFLTTMDPINKWDAYTLANSIVESKSIPVDRSYYKHSEFLFEDLHVENHRFCCSVRRGRRTADLEAYLQWMLCNEEPEYMEETKLALPPLMFQALFLIEHACTHFLYEKMSIKNICDWAMFKKHYQDRLDWDEFYAMCVRFGLDRFVNTMSGLAGYVLGKCEYDDLSPLDKRVLDDTLKEVELPKNKMRQRFHKAYDVLRSSWKFKYFNRDSMIKELSHSFFAYLFVKEPELI